MERNADKKRIISLLSNKGLNLIIIIIILKENINLIFHIFLLDLRKNLGNFACWNRRDDLTPQQCANTEKQTPQPLV